MGNAGLHNAVVNGFGILGKVGREKGCYKVAEGKKWVRKTGDPAAVLWARLQAKTHCAAQGYPWLEQTYTAKDGAPYVFADGAYFEMTDRFLLPEVDLTDQSQFLHAAEALAHWHKACQAVAFTAGAVPRQQPKDLTKQSRSDADALQRIRKRLRKCSGLSEFDVLFIKHYDFYAARIQQAGEIFTDTQYEARRQAACARGQLVHGALKEDCMLVEAAQNAVYITKWDNIRHDHPITDLCALFRRRQKKAAPSAEAQAEALAAYQAVVPLNADEVSALTAMLLYPAPFVAIVAEYYQKKRSWTPIALINKMEEVLALDGL